MSVREYIVIGRVQGVFYRATTKRYANQLGVTGFAQNQADGTVLVVAQADDAVLEAFIDKLRQGSPLSRVDEVRIRQLEQGNFSQFEVR